MAGWGLSSYQDLDCAQDAHGCPLGAGWETFGIGPRGVAPDLSQVLEHDWAQHKTMCLVFWLRFGYKLKVTYFDEI